MMQLRPLEIKEVRQLASQYEVSSAYLVPFKHESRKQEDGQPAIWYRIVLEVKVGAKPQHVIVTNSRKAPRQFANVAKALTFVDTELENGQFERISVLRSLINPYNEAIDLVSWNS